MSARRRKPRLSGGSQPPANAPRKKGESAPPRPPLSRRRKWLFRLVVMVVSPVLFFALLEAGLRLGGYGYPTGFFVGPDANGAFASNRQFGWRFFPRSLARTPAACLLSAKPAGAVRIFVLGSSAAQGVPDPSFSVGRVLEVMLRERYPELKFEVVNAAMTAINSHVVVEIARDCALHQPDLFVVYMGNNEVVGPYGPGSVFEHWSPSRRFIRANIWLKSTRVGQLLSDMMGRIHARRGSPTVWQGMGMFLDNKVTADDPRLSATYGNFRQNLVDICGIVRGAGTGVVLSTVAVNLKDCPPFASQHRSDLSAEQLAKWEELYRAGGELEGKGKWAEAIAKYEAAAQIDDRFAELRYRLGCCLLESGRRAEARDQFVSARDLDALRFRADSRINAIVREVAAQQEGGEVRLADAERSLANSQFSPDGIPGDGLFYEHVHFTFDGNYLLARAILEGVEAAVPRLAAARKQEPILSREQCAELLALTAWDECEMAETMLAITAHPPFTNQFDHAARQASAQKRVSDLGRVARAPAALQTAVEVYQAALEKAPDDWHLHCKLGVLASASGRLDLALEHLKIVRETLPRDGSVLNDLGKAELGCGKIDEAIADFRKATEMDPNLSSARSNLGVALSRRGQVDEAIAQFEKALEIDPEHAMAHLGIGVALGQCGRLDEAAAHYQEALRIDPTLALAHSNLGDIVSKHGNLDEAIAHFRKALEIEPGAVVPRTRLADSLRSRGRLDEAIAEYRKALALRPDFPQARTGLEEALKARRQESAKQ
jgi:tetratricopeptide (TPR) repeat protein